MVGEEGSLQEELAFGVTLSEVVGTMVVAVAMAGMNSETRVSFLGEPGVQLDEMERVISG